MTQETTLQEQVVLCTPRLAVTCLGATASTLWIGTSSGLWLLQEPGATATEVVERECVTSIASAGRAVYCSTWMGGGVYAVSTATQRAEQLGYPDTVPYDRSLIRMNAVALWNNTLAVATYGGLFSYSLSRNRWSEPHAPDIFQFLLATNTRLWAFSTRDAVSFDRQYRVAERLAVRVPMTPVLEQAQLWWAEPAPGGIRLGRYSPTGRDRHAVDFRLDEAASRLGISAEPTALARWEMAWYVGTGVAPLESPVARRPGMLLRLNFSSRRAELVWHGASVSALVPWRGMLMIGTRDGLLRLPRAREERLRP